MAAKALINKINIRNRLNRSLSRKSYISLAERNARVRFNEARRSAIKEFENHPATKDLEAENGVSEVLPRGNLAAALGIYQGDSAILLEDLRLFLKSEFSFRMNSRPKFKEVRGGIVYEFKVYAPSLEQFYNATPAKSGVVEWSAGSWTKLIEEGIPHFGGMFYSKVLFSKSRASRSKQAIQKGSGAPAPPIKYVSKIRDAFLKFFNRR